MKGIILAGGSGTRLYPLTAAVSKQLLPVYDKPLIFYPLSTLMSAGIREIMLISTPKDMPGYQRLLGNGNRFGIDITYKAQPHPDGLAQAFILAEDFIRNENCTMILGDNIFYGTGIAEILKSTVKGNQHATVYGYSVDDPRQFGVVEFNAAGKVISIEEKPQNPKSNYALTGLYFYDGQVADYAKSLKPSPRGELEITDLNRIYLDREELQLKILSPDFKWFDTGTIDSLLEAALFVRQKEKYEGIHIGVPEEIAFQMKWIDENQLLYSAYLYEKSPYGNYLKQIINKPNI